MFCSNCGAPLPPNGICAKCGVMAANVSFNGYMQGQPVAPQQSFYNPNPMYVQYQGPQQGYGQPYVPQENVAIKGIKDPKLVAGIGATIKDSCGSMMMVIAALLTTVAMILSYIEVFYIYGSSYYVDSETVMSSLMILFVQCLPFTMFTIGMWMITFQGFGTYNRRLYNDNACMHTSGFSTVQAGAILGLIPTISLMILFGFMAFMMLIVGTAATFSMDNTSAEDILFMTIGMVVIIVAGILMIILQSSIISQMAKIKHAIRGRNYESISMLLPVLLFVMAAIQIIALVFSAVDGEIFAILVTGINSIWYAFTGCTLLYIRSRVNNYICS